jgi:hypothetical protein
MKYIGKYLSVEIILTCDSRGKHAIHYITDTEKWRIFEFKVFFYIVHLLIY